ncbi:hypothetical protein SEA_TOMAS_66 [Streptomyces phage Tomas]|uniref:Uncharacterized protein n=1 Tax=Streptomyces phage Tomas TaxID=2914443 RepID=A0AA49BSZ1_9CAUD|nr:hypothetical protein PP453_gp213 [Streptomyces phage Tomas]UMO76255.1 hypothetical protein SEA_TOMAS_66 [Streptomyces phage Tomas]
MSINSNQIIKKPDVIIDPNFFLPPGVVDARYPNEIEVEQEPVSDVVDADDIIVDDSVINDEPEEEGEETNTTVLFPPDTMTVVSQTIRVGDNGQQVVDVVIDVPDSEESTQIDVRMTKV